MQQHTWQKTTYWLVFAGLFLSDWFSKEWATSTLNPTESIILIDNFLKLQLAYNTGAAWSLLSSQPQVVLSISLIFCLSLALYSIFKLPALLFQRLALAFIFSGALGNLLNRLIFGKVIDFIDLDLIPNYPIFNLADCWIVIGVTILSLDLVFFAKAQPHQKLPK